MNIENNDQQIDQLKKEIDSIVSSQMGADAVTLKVAAKVQHAQLVKTGNLILTLESTNLELKKLSQGIVESSRAQEKHSGALVFWTIVMACAIVVQVLLMAYQIYKNLEL